MTFFLIENNVLPIKTYAHKNFHAKGNKVICLSLDLFLVLGVIKGNWLFQESFKPSRSVVLNMKVATPRGSNGPFTGVT